MHKWTHKNEAKKKMKAWPAAWNLHINMRLSIRVECAHGAHRPWSCDAIAKDRKGELNVKSRNEKKEEHKW